MIVAPEPDPFSAHATTYYTPQTMIPLTPPKGSNKHMRKTSKEESIIISLQTELALRSELCSQYEADLKARDELVEILSKKLSDVEKEDSKRRSALRSWKKKVQELERMCRSLEEAVDHSKQESMERSIMDEASGEALRMLHRQIASLEREKGEWAKREHQLVEQVDTLEDLVKARTEDVQSLNEALWNREERDRAINQELQATKEEMDIMNDISVATFNDDALKKLMMERETEETQRLQFIEIELRQEIEELNMQSEGIAVEKGRLEETLEQMEEQLKAKDEEFATLKAELEAQWEHTEKASDKMDALRKEREEVEQERDALKADLAEMETRMSNLETEWNESENKRNEFEAELQEIWNVKEALEKEHEEVSGRIGLLYLFVYFFDNSSRTPFTTPRNRLNNSRPRFKSAKTVFLVSNKSVNSPRTTHVASRKIFTVVMKRSHNTADVFISWNLSLSSTVTKSAPSNASIPAS